MGYFIQTDTGGTFTDTVLIDDEGTVTIGKRPSTPPEFVQGVVDSHSDAAAKRGLSRESVLSEAEAFAYGTTIVTNAITTGQAGNAGLIMTRGFADTLSIARATSRTNGFTADGLRKYAERRKPAQLVPRTRRMIKEVDERIDYKGEVIAVLDEESVRAAVRELVADGATAIAVSLLWSFRNDAHEKRVREIIGEIAPDVPVTLSSEVAPKLGEYQRTAATAYNAAMTPVAVNHLRRLEETMTDGGLGDGRMLVMQGNGGLDRAATVQTLPVNLIGSGPTGGVLGAQVLADAMGMRNVICTDVGGTTFDVGLVVDGSPLLTPTTIVHQHELFVPVVDVVSIGAGGGSIAHVDPLVGRLEVGPASAGARPGPACYGQGGQHPTVTDADVILGFIDPETFLGGNMRLDVEGARAAIDEYVASPLGLSVEEAAASIAEIADHHMADLVRQMTVERGHDPREFSVFLFGGGGPLHGTAYASQLGARSMVVPGGELASVFSAWGMAGADIHHTHELSHPVPAPFPPDVVAKVFSELEQRAAERLTDDGVPESSRVFERYAELRYGTQVHEVTVPVPGGPVTEESMAQVAAAFEQRYEQLFGKASAFAAAGIEWMNFRVQSYGIRRKPGIKEQPVTPGAKAEPTGNRKVYWYEERGARDTAIFSAEAMRPGVVVFGPAVIELPTTTVAVRPGQRLEVDGFGNYVITIP